MNWLKIAILIQIASSYAFENYPSKFRKHFFFQKLGRTNIIFTFTVNYVYVSYIFISDCGKLRQASGFGLAAGQPTNTGKVSSLRLQLKLSLT